MGNDRRLTCELCQRSEETRVTGTLSTTDRVTAHQNCLLFSSGICQTSSQDDDLFGFSVKDVLDEVKRGKRLRCGRCKKNGATAGCEVQSCKRSFHYPCAVEGGARCVEDNKEGIYKLYCLQHREKDKLNSPENGRSSSPEAGPSKVACLVCEKKEGNISLESLSHSNLMVYCDKHAPASHKRYTNGASPEAGPSTSTAPSSSRRRLLSDDSEDEGIPRPKPKRGKSELSSDSDEDPPNSEMAPLESDFDESQHFSSGSQHHRYNSENPSSSGNQQEDESQDAKEDNNEDVPSDTDSQSLLLPVEFCMPSMTPAMSSAEFATQTEIFVVKSEGRESSSEQSPVYTADPQTPEPSVPQQSPETSFPPPDPPAVRSVTSSPRSTSSAISPAPHESTPVIYSPPSVRERPSNPAPGIDSASFWKSCNSAGCTEAIFSGFITEISEICGRIQSGQASRQDYDCAIAMISASGKLGQFVTMQQQELQRKQVELEEKMAAMTEIVSVLQRGVHEQL